MTLAALRHKIGDTDVLPAAADLDRGAPVRQRDTAQFIALAEQVSGQNLTAFFQTWLWDKTKPATFG